jgi:Asp/Glu/hydantoin racemase
VNKVEAERIAKLLKNSSAISQLELPALLVGVLALIPGVADEAIVGIGAIAVFAAIAIGRRYLINHREEYHLGLENAHKEGVLSDDAYKEAIKDLNTLTIEGGKKS